MQEASTWGSFPEIPLGWLALVAPSEPPEFGILETSWSYTLHCSKEKVAEAGGLDQNGAEGGAELVARIRSRRVRVNARNRIQV